MSSMGVRTFSQRGVNIHSSILAVCSGGGVGAVGALGADGLQDLDASPVSVNSRLCLHIWSLCTRCAAHRALFSTSTLQPWQPSGLGGRGWLSCCLLMGECHDGGAGQGLAGGCLLQGSVSERRPASPGLPGSRASPRPLHRGWGHRMLTGFDVATCQLSLPGFPCLGTHTSGAKIMYFLLILT